jgi:hypothetical protein
VSIAGGKFMQFGGVNADEGSTPFFIGASHLVCRWARLAFGRGLCGLGTQEIGIKQLHPDCKVAHLLIIACNKAICFILRSHSVS